MSKYTVDFFLLLQHESLLWRYQIVAIYYLSMGLKWNIILWYWGFSFCYLRSIWQSFLLQFFRRCISLTFVIACHQAARAMLFSYHKITTILTVPGRTHRCRKYLPGKYVRRCCVAQGKNEFSFPCTKFL